MALTRRQREVLDFIADFIRTRRYSPSLEEIAEHFGLSSVATVHKHVSNLEKKGLIRRDWNRSRSIDLVEPQPAPLGGASIAAESNVRPFRRPIGNDLRAAELPGAIEAVVDAFEADPGEAAGREPEDVVRLRLRGRIAAGLPIEALDDESVAVPTSLAGRGRTYVLQVAGDSMIDEQIRDGDFVVVEERSTAANGEKVVAVIDGEATLKKFYREPDGSIRLQPANAAYEPIRVRQGALDIRGVVIGLMRKYRA